MASPYHSSCAGLRTWILTSHSPESVSVARVRYRFRVRHLRYLSTPRERGRLTRRAAPGDARAAGDAGKSTEHLALAAGPGARVIGNYGENHGASRPAGHRGDLVAAIP